MIWKYIVTWVIISYQPTSCPDAVKVNEFGVKTGYAGYGTTCAVWHVKEVRDTLSKEFSNTKEMNGFIERMKAENNNTGIMSKPVLQVVKIDSVKFHK